MTLESCDTVHVAKR